MVTISFLLGLGFGLDGAARGVTASRGRLDDSNAFCASRGCQNRCANLILLDKKVPVAKCGPFGDRPMRAWPLR
jgi:hypothetical protein